MKRMNHTTKLLRSILLTTTLGMTLLLSACGSQKEIKLYGTEEEYGKVTLGEYKGLSAEKKVYEITDQAIDSEIEYMLYDYIEYVSVEDGAQEDDFLTLKMKATSAGETLYDTESEENGVYETQLGYEDFGSEFDEKLLGAKKGDHLTFSLTYDKESGLELFAGKKVDFDITVNDVTQEKVPELNDAFIKDNLGFENEAALRKNVTETLKTQYEENSTYSLHQDLIAKVIEASTVESYADDLYNNCYASIEQNYAGYMEMLGCETLTEVFSAFGITEEDLKKETIDQVNHEVVVNAIATAENIVISPKDYDKKVEELAQAYEFEDAKELKEEVGEEYIKYMIMEEMVFQVLVDHASLTEVSVVPSEEELDFEDDNQNSEDADIDLETDEEFEEIDLDDTESDEEADDEGGAFEEDDDAFDEDADIDDEASEEDTDADEEDVDENEEILIDDGSDNADDADDFADDFTDESEEDDENADDFADETDMEEDAAIDEASQE